MKTIILCGGIGYRLKEETEFKPKPMVEIGGKPILWHIMKIYAAYGFNDFIIALGYKGNYIKEYFMNQKYFANNFTIHTKTGKMKVLKQNNDTANDDFTITFVDTGEDSLPGERILRVKDYIPKEDKHFMLTYGDGVSDINVRKLVEFHKKQNTIGTVIGVHPRSKYGLLSVDNRGIITSFIEKPVLNEWINGGYMVFKREAFQYFKHNEFEHKGLKRLVSKKQLSLYIHKGFWHCMDTYQDVKNLNTIWEERLTWKVW